MRKIAYNDIEIVFGINLEEQFLKVTVDTLNKYASDFNIDRRIDMVGFLTQCKHEIQFIGTFNKKPRLEENLNFKDKTLLLLSYFWRTHQPLLKKVRRIPKKEQFRIIMNRWYNGRMGNRVGLNDGRTYVGHGSIMVTGRDNTLECLRQKTDIVCLNAIGEPLDGIFERYDIFWLLGLAYWNLNKMFLCRNTNDCTKKVNRGLPQEFWDMRLATAIEIDNSSFLS